MSNIEFVAITNDVIEVSGKHYVTIWFRGDVDNPAITIHDADEIAAAEWFDMHALPSPRHAYFDNLLLGRTMPQSPANLPAFTLPK